MFSQETSQTIDSSEAYHVEIDGQNSETWSDLLSCFDDANIYQTWAYGAVRWRSKNLSHLVLRKGGIPLVAAQLRILRAPLIHSGVAYLRWGPLFKTSSQDDFNALVAFFAELKREYCVKRGLFVQVVPNAFVDSPRADLMSKALRAQEFEEDVCTREYRTMVVDLSPELDLIRKSLDQKWRNQLNGSERNGLDFEISTEDEALDEFTRLYNVMWKRKRFSTSIDISEFIQMQKLLLGRQKLRVFTARAAGQAVASVVLSAMGDHGIYLLGASDERARQLKASYFLHWQAIKWLKNEGIRYYDLGGIDKKSNPGGYHFKSGFGGRDSRHLKYYSYNSGSFWTWVLKLLIRLNARRQTTKTSN